MTPAMVGHADGLLRLEGPADAEAAGDHDGEAAAVEIDQASFPEPVVVPIGPPSAGRALVAARQPVSIWPEFSPITTVASTRGDRVVAESSIPAAIRRKKKASTAQARQSRRAIRQRRQRCGRARRASRAHLPRSRYGVVQAARSQHGGLKNEGREAAPEHKPREPAPVAAGRAGRGDARAWRPRNVRARPGRRSARRESPHLVSGLAVPGGGDLRITAGTRARRQSHPPVAYRVARLPVSLGQTP